MKSKLEKKNMDFSDIKKFLFTEKSFFLETSTKKNKLRDGNILILLGEIWINKLKLKKFFFNNFNIILKKINSINKGKEKKFYIFFKNEKDKNRIKLFFNF